MMSYTKGGTWFQPVIGVYVQEKYGVLCSGYMRTVANPELSACVSSSQSLSASHGGHMPACERDTRTDRIMPELVPGTWWTLQVLDFAMGDEAATGIIHAK